MYLFVHLRIYMCICSFFFIHFSIIFLYSLFNSILFNHFARKLLTCPFIYFSEIKNFNVDYFSFFSRIISDIFFKTFMHFIFYSFYFLEVFELYFFLISKNIQNYFSLKHKKKGKVIWMLRKYIHILCLLPVIIIFFLKKIKKKNIILNEIIITITTIYIFFSIL